MRPVSRPSAASTPAGLGRRNFGPHPQVDPKSKVDDHFFEVKSTRIVRQGMRTLCVWLVSFMPLAHPRDRFANV